MPTYVYRCAQCDEDFEFIQTMADKPLKVVPSTSGPCGQKCKAPVERVLQTPSINIRQGKTEHIQDAQGSSIDKHWDGRQDVTVRPDPVEFGAEMPPVG